MKANIGAGLMFMAFFLFLSLAGSEMPLIKTVITAIVLIGVAGVGYILARGGNNAEMR